MMHQAKFFHDQGFNVLVPTMGGYPGSSGVATSEESICQDVEAVKKFLHQDCGVQEAGYYGMSIGGALAFQAAAGETGQKDLKTMFVIADQTFDTIPNVCSNFLQNQGVPKPVAALAKLAGRLGAPAGQNLQVADGLTQESDGLNNKEKSEKLKENKTKVFVMTAKYDKHMGSESPDRAPSGAKKYDGNNSLANNLQATKKAVIALETWKFRDENGAVTNETRREAAHCSKFTLDDTASKSVTEFIAPHKPKTST